MQRGDVGEPDDELRIGTYRLDVQAVHDALHAVPAADTHLRHVVRMALRDQLLPTGNLARLQTQSFSAKDSAAIADVATQLPSDVAEAAGGLERRFREISSDFLAATLQRHLAQD